MWKAIFEQGRPHHFIAAAIGAGFAVWLLKQDPSPDIHSGMIMWAGIIGALAFGFGLEAVIRTSRRLLSR